MKPLMSTLFKMLMTETTARRSENNCKISVWVSSNVKCRLQSQNLHKYSIKVVFLWFRTTIKTGFIRLIEIHWKRMNLSNYWKSMSIIYFIVRICMYNMKRIQWNIKSFTLTNVLTIWVLKNDINVHLFFEAAITLTGWQFS